MKACQAPCPHWEPKREKSRDIVSEDLPAYLIGRCSERHFANSNAKLRRESTVWFTASTRSTLKKICWHWNRASRKGNTEPDPLSASGLSSLREALRSAFGPPDVRSAHGSAKAGSNKMRPLGIPVLGSDYLHFVQDLWVKKVKANAS
jgi:hypothetical protein